MGSIELIIDIDEELYNRIKNHQGLDDTYIAVKNCIPLPEGAEILSKEEYRDLCMKAAAYKGDKEQELCEDEERNPQEPKMTIEEALEGLIRERDLGKDSRDIWDDEEDRIKNDRYVEMLSIAIKALEQKLREDAISRQREGIRK